MIDITIQFLMLTGIILMIIAVVSILKLDKTIKEWQATETDKKEELKRTHPQISEVNFDNILTGRSDVYNKYKNKDGLYEPVRTKNGIEIKPRKEE